MFLPKKDAHAPRFWERDINKIKPDEIVERYDRSYMLRAYRQGCDLECGRVAFNNCLQNEDDVSSSEMKKLAMEDIHKGEFY